MTLHIIAGKHKGRKIELGKTSAQVRPTSGFARQAIFNILSHGNYQESFAGKRVADICCGSGALGLEALSRGAAQATFVDQDARVLAQAKANAERFGETEHVAFIRSDITSLPQAQIPFSVLFIDPPYFSNVLAKALAQLPAKGWVDADSLILIEHDARETVVLPEGFEEVDTRRYGRAAIRILRLAGR